MKRTLLGLGCALLALAAPSAAAQDHAAHQPPHEHRHPPGVKMIMHGAVVEPLCGFGVATPHGGGERARAERGEAMPPVLLGNDAVLYLLHPAGAGVGEAMRAAVGQDARVEGTVYPAGSGYLIVVDAVEVVPREHPHAH